MKRRQGGRGQDAIRRETRVLSDEMDIAVMAKQNRICPAHGNRTTTGIYQGVRAVRRHGKTQLGCANRGKAEKCGETRRKEELVIVVADVEFTHKEGGFREAGSEYSGRGEIYGRRFVEQEVYRTRIQDGPKLFALGNEKRTIYH
jgi:hypothetical protein